MDKRDLSQLFSERLRRLVARRDDGVSGFARLAGIDRSAMSQFMDPQVDRLPRAESIRKIAEASGVSADWLLGLSHASEGGQEVAPSVEIEAAELPDGGSPLDHWRHEALGRKVRYMPSELPDLLNLPELFSFGFNAERARVRREHGERMLDHVRKGELDVEIAMPAQTIEAFAAGTGIWCDLSSDIRRRQLVHMKTQVEQTFPVLRLSFYDGRAFYSAPFTVFGPIRAAIYLGRTYLVVTAAEQVQALTRHFDLLVRACSVSSDRVVDEFERLIDDVR